MALLASFIDTFPIILFCRYFLQLKKVDARPNGSIDNTSRIPSSTLRFTAVVRNVDASIIDEFGDHNSYVRRPAAQEQVDGITMRMQSPSTIVFAESTYAIEEIAVSREESLVVVSH